MGFLCALPALRGSQRGTSSALKAVVLRRAALGTPCQYDSFITQAGQTCLESTSCCVLPREQGGTHQTEHGCLQVETLISE